MGQRFMSTDPAIGGDLLRLVTAGVHHNPLVLYREYLQNAADAIASQGRTSGNVQIKIDPLQSQITIRDDGAGLSLREAGHRLLNVGRSNKDRAVDRGFWGIGRLAALGFAELVQFATRTSASEPVTQLTWSAKVLRNLNLSQEDARAAIEKCTEVRRVTCGDWPGRFFQVTVEGISRHAASTLLNEDAVRSYIGEVCPVPISQRFPLSDEVRDFIASHTKYLVLDVRVNDDESPIERPFAEVIALTDQYSATFDRLETQAIPRLDGNGPAAIVWLAHTSYSGSIPRRLGVRGLRARVGNIQIGTESIFGHLFAEPRFNGWCVGEVHILDSRLMPNGRRDYFVSGPHLRNIENHLGGIAQEISMRCRRASSQRNKLRATTAAIRRLKCAGDLASSGYLLAPDVEALVARERTHILGIKRNLDQLEGIASSSDREELGLYENQLQAAKTNPEAALHGIDAESLASVRSAFGAIAEIMPPESALNAIEAILERLSQAGLRSNGHEVV